MGSSSRGAGEPKLAVRKTSTSRHGRKAHVIQPQDKAEQDAIAGRARARFEQALRLNRRDLRQWMRYAQLEIENGYTERARSVFERALAVDYSYVPLWLRYTQAEILSRQFAQARAVYERSITLLPMEPKLWLSYIEMEELLGNLEACRSLFRRWAHGGGTSMVWEAWHKFEKNNKGNDRDVLEGWVAQKPNELQGWLALAREIGVRATYSRAIDADMLTVSDRNAVLKLWADYEKSCGELERAQALLRIGDIKDQSRLDFQYADAVSWWTEISVQARDLDAGSLLQMFSIAVDRCVPLAGPRKTSEWRQYALLWLRYAVFAETHASSAKPIYEAGLSRWPHETFTTATLWKAYADFEIRQGSVANARKVYGSALGKTKGNSHVYDHYIELEKRLLATDKVRVLYTKYCESHYYLAKPWLEFASFEASLSEQSRAREIFKAAISLPRVDLIDAIWTAWAETEADFGDFREAREVWEQAVQCADAVDTVGLWVQFAMFEISTGLGEDDGEPDNGAVERARSILTRAFEALKQRNSERIRLFELFVEFEETYGTESSLDTLREKAPESKIVVDERGKEHVELRFPEAESSAISKLLLNARKWAAAQSGPELN